MDIPIADPVKLLAAWMDWEKGDAAPGKTIADLKRGGMRQLLEDLVVAHAELAELGGTGAGPST